MKKFLVLGGVVLVVLVLGGGMLTRSASARWSWTTQKIDSGDIAITISASGTVEPVVTVQVGSQVSGKIKNVLVQPDQHVKQGQVLAVIDPELLEAERRDREIAVKQARSGLEMLSIEREGLALREKRARLSLERVKIDLERDQANLSLAAKNLQRESELIAVNATTTTVVEVRTLERDNAERGVRLKTLDIGTLELELQQAAVDLRSLDARAKQAELAVGQSEQALAKSVTNLGYTSIIAPMDGIVLERAVDPGQTIAAQFTAPNLFKIVSELDVVRITAQIDEADVGRIRPGQSVEFEVDAYRGEKFSGKVLAVRLKSELRSNLTTYPVVIEASNPRTPEAPEGKLRPGITAYLEFEVEHKKNVRRIAAAALRFVPPDGAPVDKSALASGAAGLEEKPGAEGNDAKTEEIKKKKDAPAGLPATVYVAAKDGLLEARQIRVGDNDGEFYELLSGVEGENAEVVVSARAGALPAGLAAADSKEAK